AGCTGRERVVRDLAGPSDVVEPRVNVLPVIVPEPFVIVDVDASLVIGDRTDAGEIVIAAELGVLGLANEPQQGIVLNAAGTHAIKCRGAVVRIAKQNGIRGAANQLAPGDRCEKRGT